MDHEDMVDLNVIPHSERGKYKPGIRVVFYEQHSFSSAAGSSVGARVIQT